MPDVQLVQPRDAGDRADVRVVQRMTRVRAHAHGADRGGGDRDLGELGGGGRVTDPTRMVMERMRIRTRVDLAEIKARARRGGDLPLVGVDEGAHGDPRALEPRDGVLDARFLRGDVEAAFGGDLLALLGDEHRQLGLEPDGDRDHLVGGGHLEVELGAHDRLDAREVGVLDVAAVLAEVHGDAVGAAGLGLDRGLHGIGLVGAPRLADGGDVVDVHAEFGHR